jgi:hypothetical protein
MHYTQPQTRDRVWRQRVNELQSEIRNLKAHLAHANLRAAQADKRADSVAALVQRTPEQAEHARAVEEALRFYADPDSYASGRSDGRSAVGAYCDVQRDRGARARAVLS